LEKIFLPLKVDKKKIFSSKCTLTLRGGLVALPLPRCLKWLPAPEEANFSLANAKDFRFYVHKNTSCTISNCLFLPPFFFHRWAVASRFCMTKTYLALPLFPLWGGGRGLSVDRHPQGSRFLGTLAPLEWETEGSLDFAFYLKKPSTKKAKYNVPVVSVSRAVGWVGERLLIHNAYYGTAEKKGFTPLKNRLFP